MKAIAIASLLVGTAMPASAHADAPSTPYIPCAAAHSEIQLQACAHIHTLAAAHGLTGQDAAPDREPASCHGDSYASRTSRYIVLHDYWGQMYVGCNYLISICSVTTWSSTTVPQWLFGHGVLDPSYYCEAKTLTNGIGTGFNFTATVGTCLSNGTFWVEDEPEERFW
jgi:hypothetical protein